MLDGNPVKVAILGYGFMGRKHSSAVLNFPDVQISAVIDNETLSGLPGGVSHFKTLNDFCESKTDADVVIIATPNYEHFNQAKILLQSGYNIFLEKPYAQITNELQELFFIAEDLGRKVFFSASNRFSEVSFWLKSLLKSGKLGKLQMLQVNCFWNRNENYYTKNSWKGKKELDGGTLYTQFYHFVDLIFWLFGPAELKFATMKTLRHRSLVEIEDSGSLNFELIDEALGNLNFSTAVFNRNFESTMVILAENGTLKIGGQYFDEVEYCNVKDVEFKGFSKENKPNLEQNWCEILETLRLNKEYNPDPEHHLSVLKFIEDAYNFPVN